MKIAVVGCGALGSYYGARLWQAGNETHFLLRSDYEVVQSNGVKIFSVDGDFTAHPHAANRPEAIGPCDLVLIGLKTTANHQFRSLLPPLVASHTAIITLQNGLGNEELLAKLFREDQILCGLCFVCLNRTAPGEIHHTAHGRIVLGEYRRPSSERTRHLAELLNSAKIPCSITDNMEQSHWEKLLWNIPFNGLGVAGCLGYQAVISGQPDPSVPPGHTLSTDILLADANWTQLIRELMGEILDIADSLGHAIPRSLIENYIEMTRVMCAYKASTLIDFERGNVIELDSLFLHPLAIANRTGVSTPRLTSLCAALQYLDHANCHNLVQKRPETPG